MDAIAVKQVATQIMSHSNQPLPSTEALGNRFSELLSRDSIRERMPEIGTPNVLSDMVAHQEVTLQRIEDEIQHVRSAKQMSLTELATKGMELVRQQAMLSLTIDGATALAKSAKNSLQTLMKNQ